MKQTLKKELKAQLRNELSKYYRELYETKINNLRRRVNELESENLHLKCQLEKDETPD